MIAEVAIKPVSGAFDVPEIEEYLMRHPWVARDPQDAHTFIVGDAASLARAIDERQKGATGFVGRVDVVAVRPKLVLIDCSTGPVEGPRHFVKWLRSRYSLTFHDNDYGGEVTSEVDETLEHIFGAVEPPLATPYTLEGIEVLNDPEGVARDLVDAFLSEQGAAWHTRFSDPAARSVRIGSLTAEHAGTSWRFHRDDGAEMLVSVEAVDKLARDAWNMRAEFLRDNLPLGATLDHARYELREELAGGADRGLYRGRDRERQTSVLISIGTPQRDPLDQVRQRLGYELPGIAALRHIGPVTATGEARYDGLVEDEPAGIPSADHPTVMDAATTARLGLAVAEVVAAAHARGIVLGGLRPELVYIDGDRVTGIAPRCDVFHAKMTKPDYGVPLCFPHVYFAPEVLARPEDPPTPAADVFALAAMIAYWHTGEHPFTGDYSANVIAIMSRQRTPWRGDAKLGAIVESGLLPLPGRTTLDRLVAMLSETFALGTS